MRFVVDECAGPALARWLRGEGHDVVSIYDEARGLGDPEILQLAVAEDRVLISNDKDFGELIFREGRPHRGIVLLRLDDERAASKIDSLRRLLSSYSDQLTGRFVVVTDRSVRISAT